MIKIDPRETDNIIIVSPEAAITAEDIATLNETVDGFIKRHDKVPNLVIHASSAPHWKDFHALSSHIKFVRDHQRVVKKVAIVSDSGQLRMARGVVDLFVGAKVRRFPESGLEQAVAWAKAEDDHPGKLIVMPDLPGDVIGLQAEGIITAQDYRETLVPLVDAKSSEHDKLKLLYIIGEGFDGFSAGALWDDTRFGLSHYTTFSKIALVSDVDWVRHSVKLFGHLMPTEVMVFHLSEFDDAKAWITS